MISLAPLETVSVTVDSHSASTPAAGSRGDHAARLDRARRLRLRLRQQVLLLDPRHRVGFGHADDVGDRDFCSPRLTVTVTVEPLSALGPGGRVLLGDRVLRAAGGRGDAGRSRSRRARSSPAPPRPCRRAPGARSPCRPSRVSAKAAAPASSSAITARAITQGRRHQARSSTGGSTGSRGGDRRSQPRVGLGLVEGAQELVRASGSGAVGSFASARSTTASSAGGTCGLSSDGGRGGSEICFSATATGGLGLERAPGR